MSRSPYFIPNFFPSPKETSRKSESENLFPDSPSPLQFVFFLLSLFWTVVTRRRLVLAVTSPKATSQSKKGNL
jgi:hypothetical protein